MSGRSLKDRLTPSWQQGGVLGIFSAVLLFLAWPTLNGRTASVVPSFQTATYPWAADPRGLRFLWSQSDQAESTFPWSVLAHRTWRSGDLPLWDQHSFGGGLPWATDGVAATLYPVRAVLDAFFLPWLAHDLFVLVHLALAGAGAYWLARRWGAGLVGATVAGVGWMTNAYVWVWAPLEMVTPFFAALPLALAAVDRAARAPSRPSVVTAAVVLGLGMVSGNIAYSVILATACGLYLAGAVLARAVAGRSLRDRRLGLSVLAGAGAIALALALSAVVLVPTLLNLASISRQPFTFEVLTEYLLVPWDAYTQILERPATPPSAEQMAVMFHLTPVVVVLAAIGLLAARGHGAWRARLLIVVPVLIASTVPGAWVAFHLFPGFDAIKPYGRVMPVALLGVYVLAGLAVDLLWSLATHPRWRWRPPAWIAAAGALAVVAGVFVPAHTVSSSLVPPPRAVDDYPLFPRTPLVREAKEAAASDDWPARVLPTVSTLATDPVGSGALILIGGTALVPGLDTWGGYASAVPERTSDLVRLVAGEDPAAVLGEAPGPDISHPVFYTGAVDWPLACRVGTDLVALSPTVTGTRVDWGAFDRAAALTRLYDGRDGRLFELPDGCSATPRLASEVTVADTGAEAIDLLRTQGAAVLGEPGSPATDHVVVETAEDRVEPGATGEIVSSTRDGASATLEVSTDAAMWLVLPVSFDEGWSVTADGRELDVERVDFNRVGVVLEGGDHVVELSYRPPGWTPGLLLSLLGLLGVLVVVFLPWRRGRTRKDDRPEVT